MFPKSMASKTPKELFLLLGEEGREGREVRVGRASTSTGGGGVSLNLAVAEAMGSLLWGPGFVGPKRAGEGRH